MKSRLVLMSLGLFLLTFVSANIIGCEVQNYNMGSFNLPSNEPLVLHLNSQNIVSNDCCDKPIVNNNVLPKSKPIILSYFEQQHIVSNDCCGGSQIYNNNQLTKPLVLFPRQMNTYHYIPCCGN